MPTGNHAGASIQRARQGEPQPAPLTTTAVEGESVASKRDLASWWKNFKRGSQRREDEKAAEAEPQGIFGVPLHQSVRYANVAISLYDNEGKSYIYGYVPIVVAKCGVFLKEKATDVEGIFRLSGSEKRIKELRQAFDSPDRYGKGLDWSGYTVHDAANILRRYFNQLPEPIIPLAFYQRFRDPIRNHQAQAVGEMDGQSPSVGDFDIDAAIKRYQQLITELPPLNRQLLLYILDLLAVFASKSDMNKMTTPNLAAIFQPGILSHPDHDMAPNEYRLSQDVLIFLIENQDHFLIGMQGTAADQKTVQEVESGPPTPQVRTAGGKSSKTLGRSGSSASKYSGIVGRSVSVSSKQSRGSVGPSPVTPLHSPGTPGSTGASGVLRSNTVPPKRSPGVGVGRFQREHPSDPPTPNSARQGYGFVPGAFPEDADSQYLAAQSAQRHHTATPDVISPSSSEDTTQLTAPLSGSQAAPPANDSKTNLVGEKDGSKIGPIPIPAPDTNLALPPGQMTPSSARAALSSFLSGKSPPGDTRQPNKLRKKKMPGSANPSAHSSQNSLSGAAPEPDQASIPASTASNAPLLNAQSPGRHLQPGEQTTPVRSASGGPVKPAMSPTGSFRSHSTATDPDQTLIPTDASAPPSQTTESTRELADQEPSAEREKKRRWFSRSKDTPERDRTASQSGFAPPNLPFASNDGAQQSRSSVTSDTPRRKSTNVDRSVSNATNPESYTSGQQAPHPSVLLNDTGYAGSAAMSPPGAGGDREGRDREKNPINWIKGKLAERAEKKEERDRLKEEEKRARSPPAGGKEHRRGLSGSMQSLTAQITGPAEAGRSGKSIDLPRHTKEERQPGKSMDLPQQPEQHAVPQVVQQQAQPEPKAALVASEALKKSEVQGQGPGGGGGHWS